MAFKIAANTAGFKRQQHDCSPFQSVDAGRPILCPIQLTPALDLSCGPSGRQDVGDMRPRPGCCKKVRQTGSVRPVCLQDLLPDKPRG